MSKTASFIEKMNTSFERGGGGLTSKLPTEILFDILGRLPVKSLSLCRFVCKSWFYAIQYPSFISSYNTHFNKDTNSCLILEKDSGVFQLVDPDSETYNLKLPPFDNRYPPGYYKIYPSNGLLLVNRHRYLESSSIDTEIYVCCDYFVCNPITGDYIPLPRPPLYGKEFNFTTGFGYDPVSKLCKIMRILRISVKGIPRRMTRVEIYDLGTGKWRVMEGKDVLVKSLYHTDLANDSVHGKENKVTFESLRLIYSDFRRCAFLNGALHWMGYWKVSRRMAIISFKLDTEEFYHVPLPSAINSITFASLESLFLLVVRECLSLAHGVGPEHTDIWVMKDYGLESWEKKYVIKNIILDNGDLFQGDYVPVEFMQNGEILLVSYGSQKIGFYQLVTRKFKPLESSDTCAYYQRPLLHVCSLTSPASISK